MLDTLDFCRALSQSVGTASHLVLARFENAEAIRRTTSVPTSGLAAQRFEVAVFSAATTWFSRALLTDTHAALLFSEVPRDLDIAIQRALDAYAFNDPWAGAGTIELQAKMVVVPLSDVPSSIDAFRRADSLLGPGKGISRLDQTALESWCPGDDSSK